MTPSFALTVFRLQPSPRTTTNPNLPPLDDLNALNKRFHTCLSQRTDILLTQTVLNGVFCVRFAVGARATEEGDVLKAWEVIKEEGEAAYREWGDVAAGGENHSELDPPDDLANVTT
jgi:aromatic-L-amino-acid/L-tryptophan decarboxylase